MCNSCSAPAVHAQSEVARSVYASVSRSADPVMPGGLSRNVKTVDATGETPGKTRAKQDARRARFSAKRTSARLIRDIDEKLGSRVASCCFAARGEEVTIERVTGPDGVVRGAVGGIVTCQSVWACPVCSARIAEARRKEMNLFLSVAREKGLGVVMLTLTARHNARTELAGFVEEMKQAQRFLRQSRGWRALPLVHSVVATEVTHGVNGWHVHFHLLLLVEKGVADPVGTIEALRPEWLRSLHKVGRSGNERAFHVQRADAAGEYVAKFGAAEEIALGHKKEGRKGSRTPWQILADARDGDDPRDAALWREYVLAFKGRAQLQWSRGAKAWAGVQTLEAEAKEERAKETREEIARWPGRSPEWAAARLRLCSVFDHIESGCHVNLMRVLRGPTDAERWRDELANSDVVEGWAA